MKKIGNTILIVCLSYAVFLGCDNFNNPVAHNQQSVMQSSDDTGTFVPTFKATINNYKITADGGIYNHISDRTTFTYDVSYAGSGPSSNNFYLEIPACAVDQLIVESISKKSEESIVYPYEDPISGTTGILWNSSLSRKTSKFSISFNGDVPTGDVEATVISGNRSASGSIAGPCKGNEKEVEKFEVSGFVFVDVDDNLKKNDYETGIFNVVVALIGPGGYKEFVKTDAYGEFSFLAPASSSKYTLSIPSSIGGVEFNQKFFESYDYAIDGAEPETSILVDFNKSFDFAFSANTEALIKQFEGDEGESRDIVTKAKDFDFWRKMVRHAANETQGEVEIPKEDIYKYLYLIEQDNFFTTIPAGILQPDPFKFKGSTDAERARFALDKFLFNPSDENKSPQEIFLRELLLAELNIVSGNGVQGFKLNIGESCSVTPFSFDGALYCPDNIEEFHLALLGFGEGLAAQFMQTQGSKVSTSSVSSTSLDGGTQVFSSFNRTGSGGLGF